MSGSFSAFKQQYFRMPLSFAAGQEPTREGAGAEYYTARGLGYGLTLGPDRATFSFERAARTTTPRNESKNHNKLGAATFNLTLVGANGRAAAQPEDRQPGLSHYLVGRDPREWRTGVPHYARVTYRQVYPNIDLVYYGNQRRLEYDFVVAPQADPSRIGLTFDESDEMSIEENGDLLIARTDGATLRQRKPFAYQLLDGRLVEIAAAYELRGRNEVGFALGDYDPRAELVIDPVLVFSTHIGGTDDDFGNGIAVDEIGNCYVTGVSYSVDFPRKNPYQNLKRGLGNAWVAKFDPTGNLIFSTYLGGTAEDVGFTIAVDNSRHIYVAGSTDSNDFPTKDTSYRPTKQGRIDGFIAKLNPAGSALIYSTYLGGSQDDIVNHIALDNQDNLYAVGETTSSNFPKNNPYQTEYLGEADAFLTKLNSAGTGLIYSTYLGGSGKETAFGVTVDNQGAAYLTGFTYSLDFPKKNPLQAALASSVDAFITKFAPNGKTLEFSTYYGGSTDDGGFGIELDSPGNIYVTGFTYSSNFPTKNPFQAASGGGDDAFILKLTPGFALDWASYLGGSGHDRGFDLDVDVNGDAYIVGRTESLNFPVKDAIQPTLGAGRFVTSAPATEPPLSLTVEPPAEPIGNRIADRYGRDPRPAADGALQLTAQADPPRDAFVTKVDKNGKIVYSTFLGGSKEEKGFAIAVVNNRGQACVAGLTASSDFPRKRNFQPGLQGILDGWVAKIADRDLTHTTVVAASYEGLNVAPESIVAAFGIDLSPVTFSAPTLPLPTEVNGVSVQVNDAAGQTNLAPLFYVSPFQINYVIPKNSALGKATVSVWQDGSQVSTEGITIARVSPGIFTANADGKEVAAALVLRLKANGDSQYESIYRFDPATNRSVSIPIDLGIAAGDSVYLVLFCTGVRYRSSLQSVVATIGGLPLDALYAGPQPEYEGLDQINILLPPTLAGRGVVDLDTIVDNKKANKVTVNIK